MRRPANAVAEQVERLEGSAAHIDQQIVELTEQRAQYLASIGALAPFAEWVEVLEETPPTVAP